MDFTLNEQEEAIRTIASKFAKVELKKVAIEVEENDQPPSRDIVRKFANQGLLGVNLQTKYGGGGLGHFEAVLVLEEIAKLSIISFVSFKSSESSLTWQINPFLRSHSMVIFSPPLSDSFIFSNNPFCTKLFGQTKTVILPPQDKPAFHASSSAIPKFNT